MTTDFFLSLPTVSKCLSPTLTPALSPQKLQRLLLGKVLLHGVVNALDDHVMKARPLQYIGH